MRAKFELNSDTNDMYGIKRYINECDLTCVCAAQSRRDRSDKAELLQDVEPLDFTGEEPLETDNRRSVLLYL